MSFHRLVFGFVLAIAGLLTPIVEVSATTIRGNVFRHDGVTPLVASENLTVVALAANGTTAAFTITYPTVSSFNIEVNSALLPTDKSVTLNIKLGSSLDRTLEGINGAATRVQTIDIGVTTPGNAKNNVKTSVIRGMLTHKDGVNGIPGTLQYSVVAIDANSNVILPMMGTSMNCPTYTFTLQGNAITGSDKTLRIEYRLGGSIDRVVEGVIANSARLQTIDINYSTSQFHTTESHSTPVNQSGDACEAPRHCGPRLHLGFLRGRCR